MESFFKQLEEPLQPGQRAQYAKTDKETPAGILVFTGVSPPSRSMNRITKTAGAIVGAIADVIVGTIGTKVSLSSRQ